VLWEGIAKEGAQIESTVEK